LRVLKRSQRWCIDGFGWKSPGDAAEQWNYPRKLIYRKLSSHKVFWVRCGLDTTLYFEGGFGWITIKYVWLEVWMTI
jgi:hypothetical protein